MSSICLLQRLNLYSPLVIVSIHKPNFVSREKARWMPVFFPRHLLPPSLSYIIGKDLIAIIFQSQYQSQHNETEDISGILYPGRTQKEERYRNENHTMEQAGGKALRYISRVHTERFSALLRRGRLRRDSRQQMGAFFCFFRVAICCFWPLLVWSLPLSAHCRSPRPVHCGNRSRRRGKRCAYSG